MTTVYERATADGLTDAAHIERLEREARLLADIVAATLKRDTLGRLSYVTNWGLLALSDDVARTVERSLRALRDGDA